MFAFTDILSILAPILSAVVGWMAGRRKQKNDFLSELQSSIDLLSDKNKELLEEVVQLRTENAKLQTNQETMLNEVSKLRTENADLRKEIESMTEILTELNISLPAKRRKTKTTQTTTE